MLEHRAGVATLASDRLNRGFVGQIVRVEPRMTSDAREFRMHRLVEDRFVGKKRDGLFAGAFSQLSGGFYGFFGLGCRIFAHRSSNLNSFAVGLFSL